MESKLRPRAFGRTGLRLYESRLDRAALVTPSSPEALAEPRAVTTDTLLDAVSTLEAVLVRHARARPPKAGQRRNAPRITSPSPPKKAAFSEVANAVLHVEDAVAAVAEGELLPDSSTFRQVDAALRAARAACSMPEAQAAPIEVQTSRGAVWVLTESSELCADLGRAIAKKRLDVVVLAKHELPLRTGMAPSALIIQLGSNEPEGLVEQITLLRQRAPRMALIVLSEDGGYRARGAAALLGAVLYFVLPATAEK